MDKLKIKSSGIILAVIISFLIGLNWHQPKIEELDVKIKEPDEVDFSLFWQAWNLLEDDYVEDTEEKDLVYGAIRGLISSLGDPYSLFMDPKESRQFAQDLEGSFEGIGAEIGIRNNVLTVISPLSGMPAEKAGLLSGDKIIRIDDVLTTDLTLNDAVGLIRGPRGTIVNLTVLRNGGTKEISIIRSKIDVPSVTWKWMDGIVYIDIDNFHDDVSQEFILAMGQILPLNPKAIILDLRNNPGGFLERSIDIASWWLKRGEVVVKEEDGDGIQKEHKSHGPSNLQNVQTVILVNQGSASASEIVAGALRDQRGIKLIGQKTFGKGSVQELRKLKDSSELRLTIAKWLTPSGHSIDNQGLEPDIEVELTIEDLNQNKDPQLKKALETLKEGL